MKTLNVHLFSAYFVWRSVLGTRVNADRQIFDVINTSLRD